MNATYNIALIPTRGVANAAITLSDQLQTMGGLFMLSEEKNIPHLSVYTALFPREHIDSLQAALQEINKQCHSILLTGSHYETNHRAWISIAYAITPELLALQKTIVDACDPLRAITPDTTPFGYYNVGYIVDAPHITLTKLPAPQPEAIHTLPALPLSFTATELGLFESGEYGTCQRLLARFPLQ